MKLSRHAFQTLVREALDTLPPVIRQHLTNVVVDVEDEPSHELLHDQGFHDDEIAHGDSLFGLFVPLGIPGGGLLDQPHRLIIFQRPHEAAFPDPSQLRIEVRKTVIHEVAHHFGLTDRDLERFDADPNPFGEA